MTKINKLTAYKYVADKILLPAIAYAKEKGLINPQENTILNFSIKKQKFKSGDLQDTFPDLKSHQITYLIKKLLDQKMLQPLKQGARTYTINFQTSYLIRGVIKSLMNESFIPEKA